MFDFFRFDLFPGRWFVAATLLPLLAFAALLLVAIVRNLTRAEKKSGTWASTVYWLLGGDQPLTLGGHFSIACLIGSAILAGFGAAAYFEDAERLRHDPFQMESRWGERGDWLRIGGTTNPAESAAIPLGYRIDRLTVLMFVMVTVVGSLIFLFASGYMKDELRERLPLPDAGPHAATAVHHDPGHESPSELDATRRGRYSRFYLYLSLFAFSMLHLLIADNLFQVFVSWELVGVCSFFLIGFYHEKKSAGLAANKAFIVNRVGDAGFLVALGIAFATFGTWNIHDLNLKFAADRAPEIGQTLWVLMGLGLFLGCVGKSAQVPLQTWLPDAMEGPTPVSALIHAATMVAAGVYLVGRCFPLFSPEVLTVIVAVGLVTLFISATAALVSTDIKRVLAYSTCSQLGFMMLALGVGGWTAGLLHLLTHAVFKALLFLCAGSVIHGLHHEQDLRKMGGLRRKMPLTAFAMLIGVLAISGAPLLSGWYSKDRIIGAVLGYGIAEHQPWVYVLPLFTAGLTAFYMFRLWFLAFAGTPRDAHVFEHAHESPAIMTGPLAILAILSVGVAWGWPIWSVEASHLGHLLEAGQPTFRPGLFEHAKEAEEHNHLLATGLALAVASAGAGWAWLRYGRQAPDAQQLAEPRGLFAERWYFDAVYDAVLVRGTQTLARITAQADKFNPDRPRSSPLTLDRLLSGFADLANRLGDGFRRLQTGQVRNYVFLLALGAVGLLAALTFLSRTR
jgi:NADH-quinone oxidoreductase subunit L